MGIKSIFKYSFIVFFLILSCKKDINNKKALSTNEVVDVIQFSKAEERIKEFYLSYYKNSTTVNDDLLKRFITNRLFEKIQELGNSEDLILDYDPFIQGQDYRYDVIKKTLKIITSLNKENELKVSFNRFELENEKPTVVLLSLIKKGNIYLIDAINNDELLNLEEIKKFSDKNKNTKKGIKKPLNTPQVDNKNFGVKDYIGSYSYFSDMGKLDEIASITIGYSLEIKKDAVYFAGQGYQTNFDDLCYAKMNNGVLEIYYKKTIEGTEYNKNMTQPLVKIYKKGNTFYATSSQIKEGKEIKLKEE
ncbi:DUF5991 domain-containing protein [Olleya sp. Bg11-27]|uniref:DUF5991 domain-containing protein n=1 Tax=Olleya sp. Bg11-27 TaxID=2058135 RepID=UPI000C300E75|nr:DUF5991 domain-containing protein [Olleya sp. Bg11-27]AUC76029.1 hypothetical protein CW732_10300 [Olleya sp. Bg11-27]